MTPHAVLIVLAHGALAVVGAWLFVIDVRTHRLPNRIVLPTLAATMALVGLEALIVPEDGRLWGALSGMICAGGFFVVLRVISRGGMGGGDVKLSALLGVVLGWHGWTALAMGVASAFVLAALYAVALMVMRLADGKTRIAFGPWLIIGAVLGIAVSAASAR